MNSIHRVGVTVAGLATMATMAGAFIVQGYMAAQQAGAQATAQASAAADQTTDPTTDPTESLAPQTIYVNPVPTPQVIKATAQPVPAPAQKPPVIHVVVPAPGGGDDDGGSGD
jgi:hypothetical protein